MLTPQDVMQAVATDNPIIMQLYNGVTHLHLAVTWCRKSVGALMAVGANPNATNDEGYTPVFCCAFTGNADTLHALLDGGGNVNESSNTGCTPTIALIMSHGCGGDAVARLCVMLARPELHLDAKYTGLTAEQLAMKLHVATFATAIINERVRRQRWSAIRSAWAASTAYQHPPLAAAAAAAVGVAHGLQPPSPHVLAYRARRHRSKE